MSAKEKISPAFEPFLAESGRHDKRDAIVVYQAPIPKESPPIQRLREPRLRTNYLRQRAALQRPIEQQLLRDYQAASSDHLRTGQELESEAIGSSALPITTVEVTRRTLEDLAEQPDVVAIMPNQKIELIQPQEESYEDLSRVETTRGLTWGLERLDIPRMWETTQGEQINVAVLDTGVYGDHEALERLRSLGYVQ